MSDYPYKHSATLWMSEPDKWLWQWEGVMQRDTWYESAIQAPPPLNDLKKRWRLVPRAWLDDPESVDVHIRLKGQPPESPGRWSLCMAEPLWNHADFDYYIEPKPKQVTIPERTIPAPMREIPPACGKWWVARPDLADLCDWIYWADSAANSTWLQRGLIYSTRDDAIAAARAMTLGGQDE